MRIHLKIFFLFFIFNNLGKVYSQSIDSVQTNKMFKEILFDDQFLDIVFYKHFNNVLLNNLGPFGSNYYFSTVYLKDNQSSIFAPVDLKNKLLNLTGFRPFTNLTWINAGRREQILSINHIQKFGKLADFQLLYKRIGSPGDYINQEINDNNLKAEFNFHTSKDEYSANLIFGYYTIKNQENGGIKSISDFLKDSIERRELYEVNLKKSYYESRTISFGINQKVVLFSNQVDSNRHESYYLKLNSNTSTFRKEYFDNDSRSSIFDTIYFDSTGGLWKDSIHINSFVNQFSFGYTLNNVSIEPYYLTENYKYFQFMGADTLFNSNYLGSKLFYINGKFKSFIDFNYGVHGYNRNDINFSGNFDFSFSDNLSMITRVSHQINEPEYAVKSFASNHFKWANYNFEKQQISFINSEFIIRNIGLILTINAKLTNNYIYFDTLALPTQNKKQETISSFMIEKGYRLKNVHFKSAVIYQMTSDRYIFPLPEFIGRQIVYYENKIFKKSMKVRFGVNVSYSGKYYAYAFMPGISMYYTQNKVKLGDYPFIDVFLSTHLKRAQIFVKWEHVNSGLMGFDYFSTPNTPFLDRSFKFGVSWNMFD